MRASLRAKALLYVACAFLNAQRFIAAVEMPPPRYLQGGDDDEYHRRNFTTLSWSVALPVLSISFLSWMLKNGKRCCTYDDEAVMDDIVQCNFVAHREEPPMTDMTAEDIELENVSPSQFQRDRLSRSDPTDRGITVTCNCTEIGEDCNANDSSFSWIKGSENADYLNTDT